MSDAFLDGARLSHASLTSAILEGTRLIYADLESADLCDTDIRNCNLEGANLSLSKLVETRFHNTNLNGCWVYGASVWNVELDEETNQQGLIITPKPPLLPYEAREKLIRDIEGLVSEYGDSRPSWLRGKREIRPDEPEITVDDLAVAQFLYMLRNNKRMQVVIDAVCAKVVLILGNFGDKQKVVLDAIREELKGLDYVPVIFDFKVPGSRDTDETINFLAGMARFVIADVTNARSLPQDLKGVVESLPSVPVQPIILDDRIRIRYVRPHKALPLGARKL